MAEEETKKEEPKTKKPRKPLPSVAYLLAHGDPETAHLPKSWKETYGFPVVMALIFFISLLTFHYAPHSKSVQPEGKFKLPQRNRPIMEPKTMAKEPVPEDEL